jgi:hypothetical protein
MGKFSIDLRTSSDFYYLQKLSEEFIEQLFLQEQEDNWFGFKLNDQKVVVFKEAKQNLRSHSDSFNTETVAHPSFYSKWFEKKVDSKSIHRFCAFDQLNPSPRVATLTTVLPANKKEPFFISKRAGQFYVVPSEEDAKLLVKKYQITEEQVFIIAPSIRREILEIERKFRFTEGGILILKDPQEKTLDIKKLKEVIKKLYPMMPITEIDLRKGASFEPKNWMKLLESTQICFYLNSRAMDWPLLPLESFFSKVPTLFLEGHHSLNELLPNSNLRIQRFLIELPTIETLKKWLVDARNELQAKGVFEPKKMAKEYQLVYEKLQTELNWVDKKEEETPAIELVLN